MYIVLDDGYPKFVVGGVELDVKDIEVYVSGTEGTFVIVGDDGGTDDEVDDVELVAAPSTDGGTVTPSRDVRGHLVLTFTTPDNNDTVHVWTFGTESPPVVLKVKVKRQQGPNSGACTSWPAITLPQ